MNNRNVRS